MDVYRAYKILGLYPGASQEEVRRQYRDLAQVWHPDRFAHNERLQQKAQRNLKRINEAFEVLRDYDPPPGGLGRRSLLSSTFSAVRDLGDVLQTGVSSQPKIRQRQHKVVLGVGEFERTGFVRVRHKSRRRRGLVWIMLAVLAVAAAAVLVISRLVVR
jgi:hypothetical protein